MRRTQSAIRKTIMDETQTQDATQVGNAGPPGDEAQDLRATPVTDVTGDEVQDLGETPVTQVESAELKAILEALIFASPEPLTPKAIYKLLDNEPKEDVQAALAELKRDYERPGGLQLVEVAGGYQIVTR